MAEFTLRLGKQVLQKYNFDSDKAYITVGRNPAADIAIVNPAISRQHAIIKKEGKGWEVEDISKGNGITIRGKRVEKQAIQKGDEIYFGKFVLKYEGEGDADLKADSIFAIKASDITEAMTADDEEKKKKAFANASAADFEASTMFFDPSAAIAKAAEMAASVSNPLRTPKKPEPKPPYLSFMAAPATGQKKAVAITKEVVSIGKSKGADIRIGGFFTAAIHAVVERREGESFLVVKRRWPKTTINGGRVFEAKLWDQDVIEIGDARLRFTEATGGA